MKPYIGIVSKDPESAYGIVFPDAPGCFSAADDMDEIFAMAQEALSLWTEGMAEGGLPVPPTRDLSDIGADPEWEESLPRASSSSPCPPLILTTSAGRRRHPPRVSSVPRANRAIFGS